MAMSESTFNSYLAKILSARYGEEVRGSIHDSLQGMYDIVKQNTLDVSAASQMMAAVDSLNKIKTDATNAANAANTAATNLNRLKTEASNAASAANTAASNAAKAISKAETATSNANTAAAAANNAVLAAQSATSNANAAASKATTATSKANTAASNADEATSKANTATSKAEEATSAANNAADKANTAASNATTATSKANTATSKAEEATRNANNAASNANTAVFNANEAASLADSATSRADAAAASANSAAESVNKAKTDAEDAADKANTAASKAEEATSAANNATSRANTATNRANDAAAIIETLEVGDINTGDIATKDYVGRQIDGIEIGVRNILLNSAQQIKNANFEFAVWEISEPGIIDQEYVFSICADIPDDVKTLKLYRNEGKGEIIGADIQINNAGKQILHSTFVNIHNEYAELKKFALYRFPEPSDSSKPITVYWAKLEKGNKVTDWTPAPEDIYAYITPNENLVRGSSPVYTPYKWFNFGSRYNYLSINSDGYVYDVFAHIPNTYCSIITPCGNHDLALGTYTLSFISYANKQTNIESSFVLGTNGTKIIAETIKIGTIPQRYNITFTITTDNQPGDGWHLMLNRFIKDATEDLTIYCKDFKIERGTFATAYCLNPADFINSLSRWSGITYDYGGRNLKKVFGTAIELHRALAAEDYSQIAVGDYWPITLNGKFWDYGSYTVKSGVKYYSNNTLQTEAGTTESTYEGTYVSDTAVSFSLSGTTYYVATSDCLPYFERTCNNVNVKLEVAGINHYWRYGDTGELGGNKPHIVFISRDCLPLRMRMRKGDAKWESTTKNNPWLGSAIYRTLNDEMHGLRLLVAETDVGNYIHAGPNNFGMRALLELKSPNSKDANGWQWFDRGNLFLPSVTEVWGHPFWNETNWSSGLGNQFAIFRDSRRHISKGLGDNAGRTDWWMESSRANYDNLFTNVASQGYVNFVKASNESGVPICFVFV